VLPVECEGRGDPEVQHEGTEIRARWRMRCPGGLTGKSVGVESIADSQADVLLRITLRDGRRIRHVLKADAPSFTIDADTAGPESSRTMPRWASSTSCSAGITSSSCLP
jgi:hypothetical protein